MNALMALLASASRAETLAARVTFLQEAIVAIDAATAAGDIDGDAIALDLRASLGAIVAWGRGPRDAESQLQLQALLSGLLARAAATLHRTIAARWRQIADQGETDGSVDVARARALANAFARAAAAIAEGEAVDADVAAVIADGTPTG